MPGAGNPETVNTWFHPRRTCRLMGEAAQEEIITIQIEKCCDKECAGHGGARACGEEAGLVG